MAIYTGVQVNTAINRSKHKLWDWLWPVWHSCTVLVYIVKLLSDNSASSFRHAANMCGPVSWLTWGPGFPGAKLIPKSLWLNWQLSASDDTLGPACLWQALCVTVCAEAPCCCCFCFFLFPVVFSLPVSPHLFSPHVLLPVCVCVCSWVWLMVPAAAERRTWRSSAYHLRL